MEIYKEKAAKLIEGIKTFSGKDLKLELDVYKIIESIYQAEKEQLIEDLAFCAKYAKGLLAVSQKTDISLSEDYLSNLREDLSSSFLKFKELLKSATDLFNKEDRDAFFLRFLAMNQHAFANLVSLVEDFEKVKVYLNSQKRNKDFS